MLSIYWWEIRVTTLSSNIDSLRYLLPHSPVWTGKLSERTPQNQHIKLPMYLMCCWKRVPRSAVHCRLSSCSLICALWGRATPLLPFVTCGRKIWETAPELEAGVLAVGIRHSLSNIFLTLYFSWQVIENVAAKGIWEFGEFSYVLNLLLTSLMMHMVLGFLALTQPSKFSGELWLPRFHWCLMDSFPNTLVS